MQKIDMTELKSLTVQKFANLEPCWPEYLTFGNSYLIARIHPKHNRPIGDETVLARALAYVDDDFGNRLARLTIRSEQLKENDPNVGIDFKAMYLDCLLKIMKLPIITLQEQK